MDPSERWPIAREQLITAAANATVTIAPIANVVARRMDALYDFVVAMSRAKAETTPFVTQDWEITAGALTEILQQHL